PMPPCATRSSNTLVCRLKSSALRALSSATAIRAVLRVIEPMQHHDIASAVEDDDGHAPVVLYGFDLGRRHYFLGGLNPDRRPIGRRRRRGWRLLGAGRRRSHDDSKGRSKYCLALLLHVSSRCLLSGLRRMP